MKNSLSVMKESSYSIIRAVKLPKGFKDKNQKYGEDILTIQNGIIRIKLY